MSTTSIRSTIRSMICAALSQRHRQPLQQPKHSFLPRSGRTACSSGSSAPRYRSLQDQLGRDLRRRGCQRLQRRTVDEGQSPDQGLRSGLRRQGHLSTAAYNMELSQRPRTVGSRRSRQPVWHRSEPPHHPGQRQRRSALRHQRLEPYRDLHTAVNLQDDTPSRLPRCGKKLTESYN